MQKDTPSKSLSGININRWALFHRWWKRVQNGEIPHPACPNDETLLVPGINKDDDPMLKCLVCKTTMTLGSETLNV